MSNLSITVELVSGTDNDTEANVTAFTNAYLAFVASNENRNEKIAAAINAVFDQHKDKPLTMPVLANFAMQYLTYTSDNYSELQEAVCDYVRMNSDRHEKKDKEGNVIQVAEVVGTRMFKIVKGPKGGVSRHAK